MDNWDVDHSIPALHAMGDYRDIRMGEETKASDYHNCWDSRFEKKKIIRCQAVNREEREIEKNLDGDDLLSLK